MAGINPNAQLVLQGGSMLGQGIGEYAQRERPIGANPQALFKSLVMERGMDPRQAAVIAKILLQQQQQQQGAAPQQSMGQLGAAPTQGGTGVFPGMQAAQPMPTPSLPGAPGGFMGAKPTLPSAEGMMGGAGGAPPAPQEPGFQPPRTAQELADMQSMLAFRNPQDERTMRTQMRMDLEREQMGQKDAQFQATMAYKYQQLAQQAALAKQRLTAIISIAGKKQASAEDLRFLDMMVDYLGAQERMLAADAQATQRFPWEPANPVLAQDIAQRQQLIGDLRRDLESALQATQQRVRPGSTPIGLGSSGSQSKAPAKGVTADDVLNALSGKK